MTHINREEGCNLLYDWPIEVKEEDCEKLMNAEKATFRHSNPPGKLIPVKIDGE